MPRRSDAKHWRHRRELGKAFSEIVNAGSIEIEPAEYPELFQIAIAETVVRRPEKNVRVRIFGPLEARLQSVDRLVLGGLVEGVWPPETRADPWLSRPMRHELGLDLPERRIGLSAHDFAQALGAPEVILTRAARQAGAPTVASRFVQRLAAVAGRRALEGRARKGRAISGMGTQARRAEGHGEARGAARTPASARSASQEAQRHRDRALAARPLHDLCKARAGSSAARRHRHAAGRRRPRHGDPQLHRRVRQGPSDRHCRTIRPAR